MIPEFTGYVFPNDIHIHWSLMIVMYPYITGLVAGAFIVSSLYHVFNKEELKPVGRFALVASLCFLFFATMPLLAHLGHPERAHFIFLTPNVSSAMSGFGILYNCYLLLLLFEIWLVFRQDIIEYAARGRGIKRLFYGLLALGTYNRSEEAKQLDAKVVRVLATLGIPLACLLHGYVGFLFGALKSNPWWSTPLMPIIFLCSAIVSGIALLVILYLVAMKLKRLPISRDCVSTLLRWLWLFMIMTVVLELLEIITLAYEKAEEWEVVSELLTGPLAISFFGLQLIFGALIPFILLMIAVLMNKHLDSLVLNTLALVASGLLLIQVFSMRWNVVIGGQILSKSFRGFRSPYSPHLLGREGLLAALAILLAPFVCMVIFDRILPLFRHMRKPELQS